ncbi:MAG: ABC transporter ATP-binding protein [Planctomycetota bacterium]
MTTLIARNVWRFYEGKPAVQGLDLEVEEGSAYGFIGPNGAGKSTTLRILATVDAPDAGRVWVKGWDTQQEPERVRKALGFMPDPFGMPEGFTVEQFLEFFAVAYRLTPVRRSSRVARAIELTRIGERRKEKVTELSKGWKQRVLLAKTLIHDPDVLLLDEPAAGLDPAARIEFREIIKALRDMGKTILVSSHILTELADFCDSVGIIERGRMLVSGRIDDILERLNPSDMLVFETFGEPGLAERVLAAQPDVTRVTFEKPNDKPGLVLVVAALQGRSDPQRRAALLRTMVQAGVPVTGLRTRQEGLEDLFLKVAGKQGGGAAEVFSEDVMRKLLGGRASQRYERDRDGGQEGAE